MSMPDSSGCQSISVRPQDCTHFFYSRSSVCSYLSYFCSMVFAKYFLKFMLTLSTSWMWLFGMKSPQYGKLRCLIELDCKFILSSLNLSLVSNMCLRNCNVSFIVHILGNLETFSAIVLWAGGNPRKLVSFFLMCIMASACLTHYWLEQDFTFPLVLLGVSTTVFVLSFETTLVTKASKKE